MSCSLGVAGLAGNIRENRMRWCGFVDGRKYDKIVKEVKER